MKKLDSHVPEKKMITLKKVNIHKYKCIESDQAFEVDDDITILVGMNESGKTSILEAIAKTNYFDADEDFKFNSTHDYSRKEKKKMEKSGNIPAAVTCTFQISEDLSTKIAKDLGKGVFTQETFSTVTKYDNRSTWADINTNLKTFIEGKTKQLGISSKTLNEKMLKAKSIKDVDAIINEYKDGNIKDNLSLIRHYWENKWSWNESALNEYVARELLTPLLPKFLYYDEYYVLPSRISIENLQKKKLSSEEAKTSKALFELADINIKELISSEDFEDYKAELEATEATITEELFEYWSTNKNLDIQFDIDKVEKTDPYGNKRIVEHILDIRVRNNRTKVSLPLRHRSKGFNWFFSFLVWFKKIQEDDTSNYILWLDEHGLNLHASAQADLLEFIEHLSGKYQIIYTTHSPFMVDPVHLDRVRTGLETNKGSVVSDSIQEKDPNTLFPLQAALGYGIAQNLYISNKNLLVEGVSDLIYLEVISGYLIQQGREGLREDITIVPVGGLEKVATFVSLLQGSKLNVVCILDSTFSQSGQDKLDRLISDKIIKQQKVLHYRSYIDSAKEADVEDLFEIEDYLSLFNGAFEEHIDILPSSLSPDTRRVVEKINRHLNIKRFNHYRPAKYLARLGAESLKNSTKTLERFEFMFKAVNEAMSK